jgi:hypothetical protein
LVVWLFEHGVMPLYTPLGGSWLNMTESIERIVADRALAGQTPAKAAELIEWLETTARAWNADPTPFEWGGQRQLRRQRAYQRRHPLSVDPEHVRETNPPTSPVHGSMANFRSSDPTSMGLVRNHGPAEVVALGGVLALVAYVGHRMILTGLDRS